MHVRTPAVVISAIYLFTPMIFYPGELNQQTIKTSSPVLEESIFIDMLNGMGGPENPGEDVFAQFDDALYLGEPSHSLGIFGVEDKGPKITKIQTINHLKIANTRWPVDTPDTTSLYGWRTPPCSGCSSDHKGVDFVPGYGTPVYAVTDGMVTNISEGGGGYGVYIVLDHLVGNEEGGVDEWQTLYAHMRVGSIPEELKIGSVVKKGDVLGAVGSTGESTGPHLHFELLINGEHVDPLPLLGTYKIVTVIQEEQPDALRLGEVFKVETEVVEYR